MDERVYSITLYGKSGKIIANTQVQVLADPIHADDPARSTTLVQGQAREIIQVQSDGSNTVIKTVFQTGFGWTEQGTGELVQSIADWKQERSAHAPGANLASQFTGALNPGAYGAGQLGGFDVLPLNENSNFLVNADGDMVAELTQLSTGYRQLKGIDGTVLYISEENGRVYLVRQAAVWLCRRCGGAR